MRPKSRRVTGALLLAAACAVWGGCSVQRVPLKDPAARGTAPTDTPYDPQKERPSPPPPVTDDAASPPPTLDTPEPTDFGAPGVAVQDLAAPPVSPAPGSTPAPAGGTAASGFRVQVLASTDAAAAETARADVEARLGLKAYVRFEAPYYKVRVGNCSTNDDCQRLQEQLRAAGFMTVWVVPETIEH